ncbi:ABC transporter permease [Sphingomicrobium clamense]|uniref:ABC transporter permease n=1 Tax=Sphingomicrobium clamense TaxID=2851013 RepID=A0ABS6V690_9SPHN|nr:ABC transporter permease [Sphingomicrobium sp. B8]MBW0145080.1 ABC transporter permease [Sphingomicrobium sp. B8]
MTASALPDPIAVSMTGLVRSELVKLKGSLVMTLSIAVPGLVLLLGFLIGMLEGTTAMRLGAGTVAMWAQVLMPLGVLALTVVLAQLEHQPRAWDPLLALPGSRRRIFLVKLAAAAIVLALWHLVLWLGLVGLDLFFAHVMPGQIEGRIDQAMIADMLLRVFAASQLMLVIQYALALYFRSFVPPLVIGFGGILFALGAYASDNSILLPWIMPLNQLATEAWRADWALGLGLGGGIVAALFLQLIMQRREW